MSVSGYGDADIKEVDRPTAADRSAYGEIARRLIETATTGRVLCIPCRGQDPNAVRLRITTRKIKGFKIKTSTTADKSALIVWCVKIAERR